MSNSLAKSIEVKGLDEIGREKYITYGMETIYFRAIPDLRDGLKPVQRRIIWAMLGLGLNPGTPPNKSAKVVGETMGNYHPHGNSSIYGAMVGMAKGSASIPLIDGHGNWGNYKGNAGAERYTECLLSAYSKDILLDANYLPIIEYKENYDGHKKEPVFLPALLPNIILNKVEGMAVGATTNIPPFKVNGVIKLLQLALQRKITSQDCCTYLQFNYRWGGICTSNKSDLLDYYKNGYGRIDFTGKTLIDPKNKTLVVTSIPPYFSWEKFHAQVMELDSIQACDNCSDKNSPIRLVIKAKSRATPTQVKETFAKVVNYLSHGMNLRNNVLLDVDGKIEFTSDISIPQIIHSWLQWRIELEVESLKWQIKQAKQKLLRLELFLLAANNLDKIHVLLKKKFPEQKALDMALAKALKISEEDAHIILNMAVRRLSQLEKTDLQTKIKNKKSEITYLNKKLQNPKKAVANDLVALETREFVKGSVWK